MSCINLARNLSGDPFDIKLMQGKVFNKVYKTIDTNKHELLIFESNTEYFIFYNKKDYCGGMYIEEIYGDLKDLEHVPLTGAAEIYYKSEDDYDYTKYEYCVKTWTHYRFETSKGGVTVRWFGQAEEDSIEEVGLLHVIKDEVN